MFIPSWQLEDLAQDRQRELRREAREYHLAKLALEAAGRVSSMRSLIGWLGAQMKAFRNRLQRHSASSSSPIISPAALRDPMEDCVSC